MEVAAAKRPSVQVEVAAPKRPSVQMEDDYEEIRIERGAKPKAALKPASEPATAPEFPARPAPAAAPDVASAVQASLLPDLLPPAAAPVMPRAPLPARTMLGMAAPSLAMLRPQAPAAAPPAAQPEPSIAAPLPTRREPSIAAPLPELPELIDGPPSSIAAAVARKVATLSERGPEYEIIAKQSREIIEQVVWEIVPELAELIIRQEVGRLANVKR
jgi:hypothetical protein